MDRSCERADATSRLARPLPGVRGTAPPARHARPRQVYVRTADPHGVLFLAGRKRIAREIEEHGFRIHKAAVAGSRPAAPTAKVEISGPRVRGQLQRCVATRWDRLPGRRNTSRRRGRRRAGCSTSRCFGNGGRDRAAGSVCPECNVNLGLVKGLRTPGARRGRPPARSQP